MSNQRLTFQKNDSKYGIWTGFAALVFLLIAVTGAPGHAVADDWVAERLRGEVFAFDGNIWIPLARGDVVSDDRAIKTLPSARVTFVRGNETIELASNTQIRIIDANGRKFTTVYQESGTVTVEADRMEIQHFAVQTDFLAAVVKGTKFTVAVGLDRATVNVNQGIVQVQDRLHAMAADIRAGQRVSVLPDQAMDIAGRNAADVLIALEDGTVVTQGQAKAMFARNQGIANSKLGCDLRDRKSCRFGGKR